MTTQILVLIAIGVLLVTAINMSKPKDSRSAFSLSSLLVALFFVLATVGGLFFCVLVLMPS